jgi:hypothetical protein
MRYGFAAFRFDGYFAAWLWLNISIIFLLNAGMSSDLREVHHGSNQAEESKAHGAAGLMAACQRPSASWRWSRLLAIYALSLIV